jgi:transcriptional regulator with XRE-family HTH domain
MAHKTDWFRSNVRERVRLLGTTYVALAKSAGISPEYLSRMLSGRSAPTLPVCEAIAAALGTSLEALIADPQPVVGVTLRGHKILSVPQFS